MYSFSYFHKFGIELLVSLPTLNGYRHFSLNGYICSELHEALPQPDPTTFTTVTAVLERWRYHFECPHCVQTIKVAVLDQSFLNHSVVHCRSTELKKQLPAVLGQTQWLNTWTACCKQCQPKALKLNEVSGKVS